MKKLMIVPALALGMLFTTNANAQVKDNMKKASTEANAQYVKISKSELPAAVVASVERDFKGSIVAEAYKAEDGTFKLVLRNENGEKGIVFANASGKWIKPSK